MQERNHGFHAGHLILALMGGAIAGAGVAYLTAPASGSETRQRMRGMAHDANLALHHMPDAMRKATEAARDAFVGALELENGVVAQKRGRGQKAVTAKASKTRR